MEWEIKRKKIISVPSLTENSYSYSGNEVRPFEGQYDVNQVTIEGPVSATDAGNYRTIFTPTGNYCWADEMYEPKIFDWSIEQIQGTLEIEPTSLEFDGVGAANAKMITATSNIPGDVEAVSDDENVVSVVSSGKIVTVTPVGDGDTNITVSMLGGKNYLDPVNRLCGISVSSVPASMKATASEFQSAIRSGAGPSKYSVGDFITISLTGSLQAVKGQRDATNTTQQSPLTNTSLAVTGSYYPQILGFNHNQPVEGTGNYVDIQFSHNSDGCQIVFGDYEVGGKTGFQAFSDEFYKAYYAGEEVNSGFNNTEFVKSVFNDFLAKVETSWKSCVIDATKYSDNGTPFTRDSRSITSDGYTNSSFVTSSKYKIWILSCIEMFGSPGKLSYLNYPYENRAVENVQKQYDLFKNGEVFKPATLSGQTGTIYYCTRSLMFTGCVLFDVSNKNLQQTLPVSNTICYISPCCRIG